MRICRNDGTAEKQTDSDRDDCRLVLEIQPRTWRGADGEEKPVKGDKVKTIVIEPVNSKIESMHKIA